VSVEPLHSFAALGFDPEKLSYLSVLITPLCAILIRPFLVDQAFDLTQWQLQEDFEQLLGEQRWWFRSAGPADLFLLMRAFQGLTQQLTTLDVRLPWWPMVQQAVGTELLNEARQLVLPPLPKMLNEPMVKALASYLKVRVTEAGCEKIALQMPAQAALNLADIVPDDIQQHIQTSELTDMETLSQQVRRSGIAPQELFSYHIGDKHYRVWLE